MTGRVILEERRREEVCTDPQGRCYNGAFASSELRWTEWGGAIPYRSEEDARGALETFQKINPKRQYRIRPEENDR